MSISEAFVDLEYNPQLSRFKQALYDLLKTNPDFIPDDPLMIPSYDTFTATSGITDDLVTAGSKMGSNWILEVIKNLIDLLRTIIEELKKFWIADILPALFDVSIEVIFLVAKTTKKEPLFSLKALYELFSLFGLSEVPLRSLHRVTEALQNKVCPTGWVGTSFSLNYLRDLPASTPQVIKDATKQLVESILIREREEWKESHPDDLQDYIDISSMPLDELETFLSEPLLPQTRVQEILDMAEEFEEETKGSIDKDIYGED